mmetsp:Transcript_24520/g.76281  ORF Transcript_24520/g.76281 Transcript_24520/m.76281 type:complete len:279 (-) Transcript_24520:67-903(-)
MAAAFFRYLRNGAFYTALKRPPTVQELHDPCVRWETSQLPKGIPLQNERVRGLWLIRGCLDISAAQRIKALFCGLHERREYPWYTYEPGRDMMPLHASPALDDGTVERVLTGIDVFGRPGSQGADPAAGWPRLAALAAVGREGARDLEALQRLPCASLPTFASQPCLFLQAQILEGGAQVTPHRDALPYGGDMIATAVVEGGGEVRVGPLRFSVDPGDLYAIAHEARYDVEHEVMWSSRDRFSVTMRYGLGYRPDLPPLPGASGAPREAPPWMSDPFF